MCFYAKPFKQNSMIISWVRMPSLAVGGNRRVLSKLPVSHCIEPRRLKYERDNVVALQVGVKSRSKKIAKNCGLVMRRSEKENIH
jgi:hypothetical protein